MPRRIAVFAICAIAVVCYANAFGVPFIWDDEVLILRNHYVTSWEYLGDIFTTSHFRGGGEGGSFYRPLQIISYLIDHSLFSFNPTGYHLTNLILHVLVAVCVYLLALKLFGDLLTASLTAFIFAAHPVHTESVTFIASRADLLSGVFLLGAIIAFAKIRAPHTPGRCLFWILSSLFFTLALLTKEVSLIFLPIVLLYGLSFPDKEKKRLPVYLSFLLLTILYLIIRLDILPFHRGGNLSLIAGATPAQRLATVLRIIFEYVSLLVFPLRLHMERHFVVTTAGDLRAWMGVAVLCAGLWSGIKAYKHARPVFFCIGWFAITLGPVLNIIPIDCTMAERWLYLPSIGLIMPAAWLFSRFYRAARMKRAVIAAPALLVTILSLRAIARNHEWRNPLMLYEHDLRYSTNSFVLYNNLGVTRFRKGQMEKAGTAFKAAVDLCPNYAVARNNLGVVLENQGELDEALDEYLEAVRLNSYILAYGNAGRAYLKKGNAEKAIAVLEEGTRMHPLDFEINYHLAAAYLEAGKTAKARAMLNKLARMAPGHAGLERLITALQENR